MKNAIKFLMIGAIVALAVAALPSAPAAIAQDSGGTIIEGTFGAGPAVLTPLTCSDTACRRIAAFLFPGLLGTNPKTQSIEKGVPGALAKDWSVSADGKVITYKLVDNQKWSDGTPITSKDFAFLWKLAQDPDSGSQVVFATETIEKVETPDDYTIVVTMKSADCEILSNSDLGGWLPSHVFGDTKIPELKNLPWDKKPTVTSGPFTLKEYRTGELTSLVGNPDYTFTRTGKPVLVDGYIYKVVPDQTVEVEQFLAGEIGLIDTPPVNRRADVKAAEDKGDAKAFSFPGNSWDYLAFNLADPTNPQNAFDKDGKPIDQGKHPFFSDVQVRKAIALAIDVDAIIKGAVFGEGTRMSSFLIPTSWGHDKSLKPLAYDPEAAKKLLDDAGWKAGADGIREKNGVKASFSLLTNQGNSRREAIGTIVKDQLSQIGIQVDFQAIDFNVLIDRQNAQTFDAIILGWRNGYPDRPDATQLFTPGSDVVGSGSNFTSWNNAKFVELNKQALALPGCDQAARAKLYNQMEKIFQDDLPYVPLFVVNGMYAARSNINGFDPAANEIFWNVETWTVKAK